MPYLWMRDGAHLSKTGEIVIDDNATLEEVIRIPDLITPTGKFNVCNPVHEIY